MENKIQGKNDLVEDEAAKFSRSRRDWKAEMRSSVGDDAAPLNRSRRERKERKGSVEDEAAQLSRSRRERKEERRSSVEKLGPPTEPAQPMSSNALRIHTLATKKSDVERKNELLSWVSGVTSQTEVPDSPLIPFHSKG